MQQQMKDRAKRFNVDPAGRWFRVGVMSASAVAPLVARWNDLRTDKRTAELLEQAAELREQAEVRLAQARGQAEVGLRQARGTAEVGIREARGRIKSGTQTLLRQAAPVLERVPAVPAPLKQAVQAAQPKSRRRASTTLWLAGVAVGLVAAGVTAYIVARRRLAAPSEDDGLVELPMHDVPTIYGYEPATTAATTRYSGGDEQDATTTEAPTVGDLDSIADIDSEETAEAAPFVGNIHTMIFQDAIDEENLPSENNRIYFATEDEAIDAGYRRKNAEVVTDDEAQVSNAQSPTA